ncbi:hypothetical protein AB1Y20_011044 [Prymnesium parvum]|uniref:glucan 1,3-beta-glucosidase n=1 Tax=Prymnesium parvum TaxID=97485 RepID=A0AB34IPC2_PRYPA
MYPDDPPFAARSFSREPIRTPPHASSPSSSAPRPPPKRQLPPLLPLEQARSIRAASLHAAWHAANTRIGYDDDAADDLAALHRLTAPIRTHSGAPLAEAIEQLVLAAAWHAVRALHGEADAAAAAADDFERAEECVAVHVGEAAPLVAQMAAAAARHAAHRRVDGDECEGARRALVALLRAFHQLTTWRRAKWVGVNLGGWLLLEYGPAAPLFHNQGAEGNGEWAFAEELRAQGLAEQAGPTCADPYLGPCLEHLDAAVAMASELGLEVLLDLHGNPGGETDNKCCGRDHPEWSFDEWRRDEALDVLRAVAARYAHAAAVTGVQVCNEPSKEIAPRALVEHYVAAAAAVREGGMGADRVAVVCPMYYTDEADKEEFLRLWLDAFARLDGCVLDVEDQAHELATLCPASTVGEWSAARPPDLSEMGGAGRPTRREFFELQLQRWGAATTHGSFFWCWSDLSGPDWCLRALVPGRREAIAAAAAAAAPMLSDEERSVVLLRLCMPADGVEWCGLRERRAAAYPHRSHLGAAGGMRAAAPSRSGRGLLHLYSKYMYALSFN